MVEGVLIICILQNAHQLKCDGVRLWREELGPRSFFDRTVLRRVIICHNIFLVGRENLYQLGQMIWIAQKVLLDPGGVCDAARLEI
jgi:hypothetical protein